MKGAIELLRAFRSICNGAVACKECPLYVEALCNDSREPRDWTDEDILRMVNAPERVKNGRI